MEFTLDRSVESLARTPGVLRAMVGDASKFWIARNYGEGTFSPLDVVRHLVDVDRVNWMVRARWILEHGDTRPFPPLDRTVSGGVGGTMREELDAFERIRAENLHDLESLRLDEAALDCQGMHGELGPVTLRQLIATWTVHDLHHIAQIAKGMSDRYRNEVGPWKRFLTIMPR